MAVVDEMTSVPIRDRSVVGESPTSSLSSELSQDDVGIDSSPSRKHVDDSRVLVIECKDFEMARMPHEVSSDVRSLFAGTGSARSTQEKHKARLAWVVAHIDDVVDWLGLPAGPPPATSRAQS